MGKNTYSQFILNIHMLRIIWILISTFSMQYSSVSLLLQGIEGHEVNPLFKHSFSIRKGKLSTWLLATIRY